MMKNINKSDAELAELLGRSVGSIKRHRYVLANSLGIWLAAYLSYLCIVLVLKFFFDVCYSLSMANVTVI